jgi:hypothetical protein
MEPIPSFQDRLVAIIERYALPVLVVGGFIVMTMVFREADDREINAYLGRASGTLIEVRRARSGNYALFEYTVNGHVYEVTSSSGGSAGCAPLSLCIGRQFMIDHSTMNPEKSRVNWNMPVDPASGAQ